MAARDLRSNIKSESSLLPLLRDATASGSGVDLRGFESAVVQAHIGTITDGNFLFSVEESDDDSTYTAVDSADLLGSFSAAASASDEAVQEVGYIGSARYIRAVVTVTGSPSTGGTVGATVIKGTPSQAPSN